jgi:uncharacterized protein YndB with AHSA1/START domain
VTDSQQTATSTPDPHAITRGLVSRTGEQGEAKVQTVAQTYRTTVEDLWDAVTNPERLPRWFAPVTGDLQLGGRYQVEGNAGGTIEACEPPHRFRATWEFAGQVSWIAVTVSADGDGAQLLLEHTALVPEDTSFWEQYGPGATGVGWDLSFMGLAMHVATGQSIAGDAAAGWEATPEGMAFITESSRLWAEQSVADGTPRAAAEAAAARTTAFFTGQPEPGTTESDTAHP